MIYGKLDGLQKNNDPGRSIDTLPYRNTQNLWCFDQELHDQGWFHAESNRYEQEELAKMHIQSISSAVGQRHLAGQGRQEVLVVPLPAD